jgi:glutathione S-transferase
MAREVLLYELQHSPACAKVRICLQVKGVPYRRVAPSLGDVLRAADVPRLVLDDGSVVAADAIVPRLDVEWPAPPLVPADAEARAYSDVLEGWADAALGRAVRRLAWGPEDARARLARTTAREVTAGPLAALVAALLARRAAPLACTREEAWRSLREHVDVLEVMLGERPFLVGRIPTRADFAAAAQLMGALRTAADVRFDDWPAVSAWLDRLDALPVIGTALRA